MNVQPSDAPATTVNTNRVLWIVGEPGVGKTTLARKILSDYGTKTRAVFRPKWTEFLNADDSIAAAAVGWWRGDPFDGGDTVPPGDIHYALARYASNYTRVPLVLFDGDKFANEGAWGEVIEGMVKTYGKSPLPEMVCFHVVGEAEAEAGRIKRAKGGRLQDAAWVKGRRTKAARFAEEFPGEVITLDRSSSDFPVIDPDN